MMSEEEKSSKDQMTGSDCKPVDASGGHKWEEPSEDPLEGLKQLELMISEAKEYESNQKVSFNCNKMLNDLLDKPIGADSEDNAAENDDISEGEPEEEEEIEDDVECEDKGVKRDIDGDVKDVEEGVNGINGLNKKIIKTKKDKKKKKTTNPTLRKNIKSILKENELDLETQLARKEEEERIARQRERSQLIWQMNSKPQLNQSFNTSADENAFSQRFDDILDEVVLSSDEEEEDKQRFDSLFNQKPYNQSNFSATEVIDLSSSDDEMPESQLSRDYSNYGIKLDYNMTGAYDDDVSILDSNTDALSADQNNMEDQNNCGSHTDDAFNTPDSEGRVLVNVAHPPDDPDIYLAPQIARRVKPHQIGGIRFLYDNVIESLDIYKKSSGFGCILSHSMGLGKTMQVIAFIDAFLTHTEAKYVLCIVPINTLQNWISEFDMWLPEEGSMDKYLKKNERSGAELRQRSFKVYAINDAKSMTTRAKEILKWRKSGGVLLLGYEMYRILTSENRSKSKKDEDIPSDVLNEINAEVKASLIDPGPDLVVCDEGHRIKNCNAATSQALKNIKTKRRIVLTGYPLQNKLLEYWCMVDFVRPNYLGLKNEFTNMFERPINNGQCSDSTPHDRKIMKYRAHVLYQLLKGFVQRRSHSVLKTSLPQKSEYVLMCRMTPIQKELMLGFLDTAINDPEAIGTAKGRISILTIFAVCLKVWNHTDIIYDIVREGIVSDDLDLEIPAKSKNRKKKTLNAESIDNTLSDLPNNLFNTPLRQRNDGVIDYSWAESKLIEYIPGMIENSYKMVLLFEIISQSIAIGDRLLVFSQSLLTLDLIERFLKSREVPKTTTKWCKNKSYYRLDGSTAGHEREKYINLFNNEKTAHLFLISTRAGSLGINLIGANRIIIFDSSWNPCHDAQAACRIYRYGQPKKCYIYRFVCDNSLEKKIYDRQVNKQGMANRVVDEQNIEANFTWREIHSLLDDLHHIKEPPVYVFSDQDLSLYEDQLIQNLCVSHNYCLTTKPFEHESLLLDHKEQKLSSAEKRIAFGHYNEAKRLKGQHSDLLSPYSSILRSPMTSKPYTNPINPYSGFTLPYNMSMPSLPSQMTPTPHYIMNNMPSYPDISQPLPPFPPQPRGQTGSHFQNFESIAETLVRNGNTVKKVRIPNDLKIKVGPNNDVMIKKNDEVMIIQTQKGLYLRTNKGEIIAIRNANNLFSAQPLPSFMPISNNDDSFGIIQPNLQCGGTVHCMTPSHSRASSTVSHPPEVVQLSDDEDDSSQNDRTIALESSLNSTQSLTTSEHSLFHQTNTSAIPSEPEEDNQLFDSFSNLDTNSYELSDNNDQMLFTSHTGPSIDSLLESSMLPTNAFHSTSDSTYNLTTPSPQLNGSSVGFESL